MTLTKFSDNIKNVFSEVKYVTMDRASVKFWRSLPKYNFRGGYWTDGDGNGLCGYYVPITKNEIDISEYDFLLRKCIVEVKK